MAAWRKNFWKTFRAKMDACTGSRKHKSEADPIAPDLRMDCHTLPRLLKEVSQWTYSARFSYSQIETLMNYFLQVEVDSTFIARVYEKLGLDQGCFDGFEPRNYSNFEGTVVDFLQGFEELFRVPKLPQLSHVDKTLKQNEILAGFISFLLQLLDPRPSLSHLTEKFPLLNDGVVVELRYLVAVLGDAPFQATEHKKVQRILVEFEAVANAAGTLVHSLVFGPNSVLESMDDGLANLLECIRRLKAKIIKFLNALPKIVLFPKANCPVDYLVIVDSLVYELEDLLNRDDARIVEVKDQISVIHQWLIQCQSSVNATQRSEAVMRIIAVASESEYLINSFLVGDVPLWYLANRLTHVTHKIKLLGSKFEEAKKDSDVGVSEVAEDFGPRLQLRLQSNRDPVDDIVVGFQDQERIILDQLVGGREQLQIIYLVGMPGIGKTTLARKLYNHALVSYHFDKSLWCVVSQTYQRKSLLINILMGLRSETDHAMIMNMDEESLALQIYKSLKGRRYLMVIDDIWNSTVWEDLHVLFPNDKNGSRILFTTRDKDVAPSCSIIHEISLLSNDQCWELLERKVFGDETCPPWLEGIGKKIAANCRGLPLSIVVISGVLSTMANVESKWKNVGESLDSFLFSDQSNSILQVLELSYEHLPQRLKPCFLYFGLFREDAEIPVKKLTQLWVAEGLIQKEENRMAESIAEEYLLELIAKSLVIVAKKRSNGGAKACVIHDLLHELCLKISEKEYFVKSVDHDCSIWNQKYHRLCVHINRSYYASPCHLVPYSTRIRCFSGSGCETSFSLLNMKLLRVLFCQPRYADHDLFGIQHLVHLRYLAINSVPVSLHSLVNLEYLIVNNRFGISPQLLQMVKLRYFYAREAFFAENCSSTSQPCNIEFLSEVEISGQEDQEMLKCFPRLRKLKCVYTQSFDEYSTLISFLVQLESLTLMATWFEYESVGITFPFSLKKLNLTGLCLPWEKMSIIGVLPNLEVLKLRNHAFEGDTWDTNDGEFKQLRFLKLESLDLTHWNVSSSEHFPKLQQLVLHDCRNLREIPSEMGNIATLDLIEVRGRCRESLVNSAVQIQQEQQDMGIEDLRVDIQRDHEESSSDEESSSPASDS